MGCEEKLLKVCSLINASALTEKNLGQFSKPVFRDGMVTEEQMVLMIKDVNVCWLGHWMHFRESSIRPSLNLSSLDSQ